MKNGKKRICHLQFTLHCTTFYRRESWMVKTRKVTDPIILVLTFLDNSGLCGSVSLLHSWAIVAPVERDVV